MTGIVIPSEPLKKRVWVDPDRKESQIYPALTLALGFIPAQTWGHQSKQLAGIVFPFEPLNTRGRVNSRRSESQIYLA